jgi:uncharacterized protein (DUF58 family)
VARLGTAGFLGLAVAVALGRLPPQLIAAASLAALTVAVRHGARPVELELSLRVDPVRCLEGTDVGMRLSVQAAQPLGEVVMALDLPPSLAVLGPPQVRRYRTAVIQYEWLLRAQSWGRHEVGPVHVRVRTLGLGWTATAAISLSGLTVLPPPLDARSLAVPPHLRARLGQHVSRRPGTGVEFLSLRAYAPGDPVRHVNWRASSRLRSLVVNEYAGERAAEVVTFVDTTADIRRHGSSTLASAVRGAAGIAQAYLAAGDRVGVVAFGVRMRWLLPDQGTRQYYRILEHALDSTVDEGFVPPALSRLPRPVLPSGALVYVFSPLLDVRVVDAVADLRQRGHPIVVVDVLEAEPEAKRTELDQLALRIWRLDRAATVHRLHDLGAVVLPWDPACGVLADRVRLQPLLGGVR